MSIEQAQRLTLLKNHSAWNDLFNLSLETVQAAKEGFLAFKGWDKDELMLRMASYKAAEQFHQMLFRKIDEAIQNGIDELRANRDTPSPDYFNADDADDLRNVILGMAPGNEDDTRIPGTYH